ncbi:unnamed protein product [Nezara viridula]|uniref:Uncharacterized protein n=1 Tax=Nezara viridula TaxID=85310 RepID=A0A9P0HDH3_NEZVI|nr:unnamed protein product [Nezara viridula]
MTLHDMPLYELLYCDAEERGLPHVCNWTETLACLGRYWGRRRAYRSARSAHRSESSLLRLDLGWALG